MAKRCKNCKQKFEARFKTTERYCWEPDCKTIEAMEIVKKNREQRAKSLEKVNKGIQEKRERKSLQMIIISVKQVCHEYIRERDKGKPCVSCGALWASNHQAGHWKKAELYSSLRFDQRNINGQCEKCNIHLDGNVQRYGDRIAQRIGEHGKANLEELAAKSKQEFFKWDRETLIQTREYYKKKLKELKP